MKVLKIIFIVICLLFLLLPLVLFDFHSEISIEENKMLQRFPKLFNNRELNKNFRTELVSYVDDRFGAKKTFRRIYSSTIEPITPKRTGNVVGGDGFVFSMDEIEAFLNFGSDTATSPIEAIYLQKGENTFRFVPVFLMSGRI